MPSDEAHCTSCSVSLDSPIAQLLAGAADQPIARYPVAA
jgi:transcription elongation GreA/GreB family factor